MVGMNPLRFVLILFLTFALDFATPLPSPAGEISEFEEAAHGRRGRVTFGGLRDVTPPTFAHPRHLVVLARPEPTAARRASRPTRVVHAPKLPSDFGDAASGSPSEDH
jgi:hypothetical protein